MKITYEGLVSGVRFLQEHCEGFDDGTGDDFHTPFIRDLLMEICHASGITLDMPAEQLYGPETNVSQDHQETGRILAFLVDSDGERSTLELDFHFP